MKNLLILVTFVGVTLPSAFAVQCFLGVTRDEELEIPDTWGQVCEGQEDTGCTVGCDGENAVCFKVRYDGEDDFESIYGCTMQWDAANDQNSRLPYTEDNKYTAETVALAKLLDPEDEDSPSNGCLHDDDYVGEMPGGDMLGGEDVSGDWCTCEKDACNGAQIITGTTLVAFSSMSIAFLYA